MAKNLMKMLAEANAVIDTIAVHDALRMLDDPDIVFIDIRETVERQQKGAIPGAVHAARGFLEFIADPQGPLYNEVFSSGKKLILYCATGGRSSLAVKTLRDMGLEDTAHIAGGVVAWSEAGGRIEKIDP